MAVARTRAQRRDETRRRLLGTAARLMAVRGFHDVSVQDVVVEAGVTKGAFYHHFDSKEGLFDEVVAQAHGAVAAAVRAAADQMGDQLGVRSVGRTTVDAGVPGASVEPLLAGCRAFVATALDERYRRVLLVDGPAVLGWARWRAMDEGGAGALLRTGLTELAASGSLPRLSVEALTRLLSGAMNEAALWIAEAPDASVRAERLEVTHGALRRMVEGVVHVS